MKNSVYNIDGYKGAVKVEYVGYYRSIYDNRSHRIHYYNNIAFTSAPFYLSVFIFYSVLAGIVYDMKLEYLMGYVLTPFIMFVGHIFSWINELSSESVYYGRYNSKIRMSLLVGFILFLVSEAMLFLGFFWTFFDRLFALPAHVPQMYTIEHINCTGAPLLGTVLLIASGYCANISFYQAHAYELSRMMHRISIVLGMAFLAIQVYEYQELMSSISYNVFYSIFFVLTGFHGFHVIVGLLFLLTNDYILYIRSRTSVEGMLWDELWYSFYLRRLPFIKLDRMQSFGFKLARIQRKNYLDMLETEGPAANDIDFFCFQ